MKDWRIHGGTELVKFHQGPGSSILVATDSNELLVFGEGEDFEPIVRPWPADELDTDMCPELQAQEVFQQECLIRCNNDSCLNCGVPLPPPASDPENMILRSSYCCLGCRREATRQRISRRRI